MDPPVQHPLVEIDCTRTYLARRFSHTWVTDWQIAPRAFTIINGMTLALPPEYVDRLLSGQNGHLAADLDFQTRLLLFEALWDGVRRTPAPDIHIMLY